MANIINSGKFLARDGNGVPYAGAELHTFLAGSAGATPQATYTDSSLGVANANPVILDADGRADVWIGDESYLFILTVAGGSIGSPVWTTDDYREEADLQSEIAALNIDSIADLRLADGANGAKALVNSYYAPNLSLANPYDGGAGTFAWDATSTESDDGGIIIKATAVFTGRWIRVFDGAINVLWYGAKGDGATDDHPAIQAAINYIGALGSPATNAGQHELYFPSTNTSNTYYNLTDELVFNDILQTRVYGSQGVHIKNTTTDKSIFRITATAFPNVFGFIIEDLFLENQFAGTTPVLHLEKCILSWFQNLYIDQSPGHGIRLDGTSAENHFNNIFIEDAGKAGISCVSDLNHFTNIHVLSCGESGIDNSGDENSFTACKAYLNQWHGMSTSGQLNQLVGCSGRNNSQSGGGVYSGLSLAGNDNQAVGFQGYDTQGTATQRYGIRVAGTDNMVVGVSGTGNTDTLVIDAGTTSDLWMAGDAQVNGFTYQTPIIHKNLPFFGVADTTPSVSGGNKFRTENNVATSITTFDDGTNGQSVRVVVLDGNTTFVHSANFYLTGAADIVGVYGDMIDFELVGAVWFGRLI